MALNEVAGLGVSNLAEKIGCVSDALAVSSLLLEVCQGSGTVCLICCGQVDFQQTF